MTVQVGCLSSVGCSNELQQSASGGAVVAESTVESNHCLLMTQIRLRTEVADVMSVRKGWGNSKTHFTLNHNVLR